MAKPKLDLAVLVVDDDAMVRNVVIEYLKSFGMTNITEARSGTQAVKLLNDPKFRVALVLSDWEMPEVSGLALLKSARRNPKRKGIAFIMITSQRSMERFKISQAAQWGVDAYLVKPFRADLLKERIWTLLGWDIEPAGKAG
jgi:two-component system chemotaxis response regulator CheY